MVSHAQKVARDDGIPPLLRRDFNTVDGDSPGVHFLALGRMIDDFVRVRGNYLIPPRENRAVPE